MYIPPEKIKDPTNSEAEDEMIIGTFLRQLEEEKIKARWQGKLELEHGFARPNDPPAKRVTLRRVIFAAVAVAATALILLMVLRFDRPNGPELLASETEDIELIAFRGSGRTAVDAPAPIRQHRIFRRGVRTRYYPEQRPSGWAGSFFAGRIQPRATTAPGRRYRCCCSTVLAVDRAGRRLPK